MESRIRVNRLSKSFTLHNQGGVVLPVLRDISLAVEAGECVVLAGPSGAGKSTLLRCLYGNYLVPPGCVQVLHGDAWLDLATSAPQALLQLRRTTVGYVSQFLRVIPRVPALDIVAEPLLRQGVPRADAVVRAERILRRLHIPERLWPLPPATFSGGEQQRVNLARGFVADYPVLLLDEPTASLDKDNRRAVVQLVTEVRSRGAAIVGIFHDKTVQRAVGTRTFDLSSQMAA
jgi:alpha-D-ribose 1-methylphosphonate 5-triphosphate synthase subunit PhnL